MPFIREGWYPMPTEDRRHEQFTPKVAADRRPVRQVRQTKRVELYALTNPNRKPAAPKKSKSPVGASSRYLSIEQREEILKRLRAGAVGVALAREYGVTKAAIYSIKCGRTKLQPRRAGQGRPRKEISHDFD